jgi:hypothetical protein
MMCLFPRLQASDRIGIGLGPGNSRRSGRRGGSGPRWQTWKDSDPHQGGEHGQQQPDDKEVSLDELHETHIVTVPRTADAMGETAVAVVVLGERQHLVLVIVEEVVARDEQRAGGDQNAKVWRNDERQPPRVAVGQGVHHFLDQRMAGSRHHEAVGVADGRGVWQHDRNRAPRIDGRLAAGLQANVEVDVDAAILVENEEARRIDTLDRLGVRVVALEEPWKVGLDQFAIHLVGPEHVLVALLESQVRVRPRALQLLPFLGQLVRLVGLVDDGRNRARLAKRIVERARMVGLKNQQEPSDKDASKNNQCHQCIADPTK